MGSAASCLAGNETDDGQSFVRRKVSRSEVARPLTKKLSNLNFLNRESGIVGKTEDDQISEKVASSLKTDDTFQDDVQDVEKADDIKPKTSEVQTTPTPTIENITSAESDVEEQVKSVKDIISAFEEYNTDGPESLGEQIVPKTEVHDGEDVNSVQDKIAKFNALEQNAAVDTMVELQSGQKDSLVVRKSNRFMACAAVFENETAQSGNSETPHKLALMLESETSSEEANGDSKNEGSGRTSPRHVADFLGV